MNTYTTSLHKLLVLHWLTDWCTWLGTSRHNYICDMNVSPPYPNDCPAVVKDLTTVTPAQRLHSVRARSMYCIGFGFGYACQLGQSPWHLAATVQHSRDQSITVCWCFRESHHQPTLVSHDCNKQHEKPDLSQRSVVRTTDSQCLCLHIGSMFNTLYLSF